MVAGRAFFLGGEFPRLWKNRAGKGWEVPPAMEKQSQKRGGVPLAMEKQGREGGGAPHSYGKTGLVRVKSLLITLPLLLAHCTGELPLSDLVNNTITLKFLGTYESNDPYGFRNLAIDDVITAGGVTGSSPAIGASDLTNYVTNGSTGLAVRPGDVKYYMDIAEIRIARGQGKSPSQRISDYWSQFAIDRQLFCSDYNTAEGDRILQNCADQNGMQKLADFFNGGFTYPAVDIESGVYNHLGIYFRRFVIAPAVRYNGTGSFVNASAPEQTFSAAFDNRTIYGFDVATLLQNNYGETASEPRMFPLQRKDLSIVVQNDHEPYVLEVRIFVKNSMMVHILQPSDANDAAFTYVAPADWNVNHAFTDTFNGIRQGGSLLMTARTYQPAKVGSLQMNSTFTTTTNVSYFAAVPAGSTFDPKVALPLIATRSSFDTIKNVPPGTYDVYRTCDVTKCTNSSTAGTCDNTTNAPDSFPETAVLCEANRVVSTQTTTTVATAACATIPNCN